MIQSNPISCRVILLIDPDISSAHQLCQLLLDRPGPPQVMTATHVSLVQDLLCSGSVDWLFIRIAAWDDYQQLTYNRPHQLPHTVFLSGRFEKGTRYLPNVLDAHLMPPYRPGPLTRILTRLASPSFIPRPLDLFFLKTGARFEPVRYSDLREVHQERGTLRILTRQADYEISSTFPAFQARLPFALIQVRRGRWINERYRLFR